MERSAGLVLASSSPRRREILGRLGLRFRVVVPDVDETPLPGEVPRDLVLRTARNKARAVAERLRRERGEQPWVLAADTVVVADGTLLGKPADRTEASAMLATLSGRDHTVLTGFCIVRYGQSEESHVVSTTVRFKDLTPGEIEGYVASGEPFDKAGGYGIQGLGCFLVERIDGSYDNVVGLPACAVIAALERLGALPSFPLNEGAES